MILPPFDWTKAFSFQGAFVVEEQLEPRRCEIVSYAIPDTVNGTPSAFASWVARTECRTHHVTLQGLQLGDKCIIGHIEDMLMRIAALERATLELAAKLQKQDEASLRRPSMVQPRIVEERS